MNRYFWQGFFWNVQVIFNLLMFHYLGDNYASLFTGLAFMIPAAIWNLLMIREFKKNL